LTTAFGVIQLDSKQLLGMVDMVNCGTWETDEEIRIPYSKLLKVIEVKNSKNERCFCEFL
jgi:hypothetical protein